MLKPIALYATTQWIDTPHRSCETARMSKAICLGKNYLDHAAEMKEGVPEVPVLFIKPLDCCIFSHGEMITAWLPLNRGSLHHECEIVLRISKDCFQISESEADDVFDEVALGLDMTLRDLQAEQKKKGAPWEIAKAFPHSGLIGPFQQKSYLQKDFRLEVDGGIRQTSHAKAMRFNPAKSLSHASQHFLLKKGDLIFTGTPAGVQAVNDGSVAQLFWGDEPQFKVTWDSKRAL